MLLSAKNCEILYPLEDLFKQDFSVDSLTKTAHRPSAINLVNNYNIFDEKIHGLIVSQLRNIARNSVDTIFNELQWPDVINTLDCDYDPSSNSHIKDIYDACGVHYEAKLEALPTEAQVAVVLKIYDQNGLTQPSAQLLKFTEDLSGQKYLEHKKKAKLSIKSATTYIVQAIAEAEKLSKDELKFLYDLRHMAYPLCELSENDAHILMKEHMTEFLNTTVTNNFQFNAEKLKRILVKAERTIQIKPAQNYKAVYYYPLESEKYFKSTSIPAPSTELAHKKSKTHRSYPPTAYLPKPAEIELYKTTDFWEPRPVNAPQPPRTTPPIGTRWCTSCGHFHNPGEHTWTETGDIVLENLKIYGKVSQIAEDKRILLEN